MTDIKEILTVRFSKLGKHFTAFKDYHNLIVMMEKSDDIYDESVYQELKTVDKAVFDAYLKRFSSIQDYLGTKIFPVLVELTGSSTTKMSEILLQMEKEEIIESFESWIELRERRNALEHEYPDELKEALEDLKKCVNSYSIFESCYIKSVDFIKKIYKDFDYEIN